MISLIAALHVLGARSAALLLTILCLPVWLMRVASKLSGNNAGRVAPELAFWKVACGELAFVGPTAGEPRQDYKPGLVSPAALRRRMGLAHSDYSDKDSKFFATASTSARFALLARYTWACLLSAGGSQSEGEVRLFGVRIDALSMRGAVDRIIEACETPVSSPMKLVAFVNPDCLNKATTDRDYHYLLNRADLVLPDGSGLRIAGKMLGLPFIDNVNGTDLFPVLCARAAETGKRLFLYGGRPGVALEASERMREQFPGLEIAGCLDGYSHRNNPFTVVKAINASGADIVLAGLGAPNQERWLLTHRNFLQPAVGIGVGGLFDYYSGRIVRAPIWMRELGLEWVWRILQEPREKWRRYVIGNPLFLARVMRERWVRRRMPERLGKTELPTPREWAAGTPSRTTTAGDTSSSLNRRWRWGLLARNLVKRVLDVSVAGVALLMLSPLFLATAASIRLESPGPILFRQLRVGRRGRVFPMLKFRSMFVDAEQRLADLQAKNESSGGVLFKIKDDPRITRVGKLIRRFSIDELPQLINVMRGEMSIVGPRPALPSEVEQYSAADRKRLQANPGLTCLWQIGGRSDLSFEQQVELDVDYLRTQNMLTDIGIIARTVPAVINGKGAY